MLPRSNTLFHFTKNMDILFSVLKDGFWPRYCLEDTQWYRVEGHEYKAFAMVCFCDIPISRISDHVGFYGSFGIGLTKEWALKNDLNPVLYIAGDNPLYKAITTTASIAARTTEKSDHAKATESIRCMFAHIKPVSGHMIVNGEPVQKEFYQESEWRFVARNEKINAFMSHEQFRDEKLLKRNNELTWELCRLKCLPSDVRYIFVPTDGDIPNIMNFLQTKMDQYPNADLKVLMSRVTSLESISRDL
jgi:hypothetical protein